MQQWKSEFYHSQSEFTPIPFWFWNDQLDRDEITRQIYDFKAKGVDGFVIHPRIGIPESLVYLSEEFLDYVEHAVQIAEELDMIVYLYDEAMYPSGSANGRVVAQNPDFASKGLKVIERSCSSIDDAPRMTGDLAQALALQQEDEIISVQAVQKTAEDAINLHTVKLLSSQDGKMEELPKEAGWHLLVFVMTPSQGVIRGIHFGQEDKEKGAPRSADLLNPDAVQSFIALTHEVYRKRLHNYFGKTIQAMFTDEPNILGRWPQEELMPWTRDFLDWYVGQGNDETHLSALWYDAGIQTEELRRSFQHAVKKRLESTYYQPISSWCEKYGLALTGHPSESGDIGLQHSFHIPGQDLVWRWVAPEDDKGLIGAETTLAKCSSDAARHRGRRKNANECFGASGKDRIGWHFTADDMKWYMDWLFVRGVNLLIPHAFYYSVEGERKHERPPDVGPNNIWWPHYSLFAEYVKRMSWIMTDSYNCAGIAVLCGPDQLPWQAAQTLYQHQMEFNYLEESLIAMNCTVNEAGKLDIEKQSYEVVLMDSPVKLSEASVAKLQQFSAAGGTILARQKSAIAMKGLQPLTFASEEELLRKLQQLSVRDIFVEPQAKDLRISHVKKGDQHYYVLVNEGEQTLSGKLSFNQMGRIAKLDPWKVTIDTVACRLTDDRRLEVQYELPRRESLVYCIDEAEVPLINVKKERNVTERMLHINEAWNVLPPSQNRFNIQHLTTWTDWVGMEEFTGTCRYETVFQIKNRHDMRRIVLDLGTVHDIAKLYINHREIGVKMWGPYAFEIFNYVNEGHNVLTVEVTNSLANRYNQADLPSGMLGPVTLKVEMYKRGGRP